MHFSPLRALCAAPPAASNSQDEALCVITTGVTTSNFYEVGQALAGALSASFVSACSYHECEYAPLCVCDPGQLVTTRMISRIAAGERNGENIIVACRALTSGERRRLSVYARSITLVVALPEHVARARALQITESLADSYRKALWRESYVQRVVEQLKSPLTERVTRDLIDLEMPTSGEIAFVADGTLPASQIAEAFVHTLANWHKHQAEQCDGKLQKLPLPRLSSPASGNSARHRTR